MKSQSDIDEAVAKVRELDRVWQEADGAYSVADGPATTNDTTQTLRCLCDLDDAREEALEALRDACVELLEMVDLDKLRPGKGLS